MTNAPKDNKLDADNSRQEPSDRELQISQLLAEYFRREDSDQAIIREEFLEEHAELADELRGLLQMGDMVQELAGPVVTDSVETSDDDLKLPIAQQELEVLGAGPTRRKKVGRWIRNMPVVGKLCGNPFPQPTKSHTAAIGAMCVLPLLAVALLVVMPASRESHIPLKPLLGTGAADHFYDQVGRGLVQALFNHHGVAATARETHGSEENIRLLLFDLIQVGIAQREVISASQGVSIVAPLYADKIHVVVRRDADIRLLKALENHNVSLGPIGSAMRITSLRLLQVLNLNLNSLENNEMHFDALLTEDALDAAIVTTRTENRVLQEILADQRFELLTLSPQEIGTLIRSGYHRERIQLPNGPGVETVGTMAFLICREDASAAWVEMLLTTLYDDGQAESVATRLNLLPRNLAAQYPVQFHRAAKKYFQR